MSFQIRRAELDSDRNELIDIVRRNLNPLSDTQRFSWLYRDSPHGQARGWVMLNAAQEIVGAAAAFPRRISVQGEEKTAWVFGDFCIDPQYRTLGPALQLQRQCLNEIAEQDCELCYDFPSQTMVAVYKRLGIEQQGTLVRWAKPLRVEHKIEEALGSKALAQGLGRLVNAALAHRGWKGDKDSGDLALHTGRCGDEFTALDLQQAPQKALKTVRSSKYLNWRYFDHPATRYEILTARRAGILIGYIVFAQQVEYASIADLCSVEEPAVIARLLAGTVELLKDRGVMSVSLYAGESHPWNAIFESAGFGRREATPMVVYEPFRATRSGDRSPRSWFLMQGERDS